MRPLSAYLESSSNSQTSQEKLKQHRDSFLLQRRLDDIGNSIVFGTPLGDSINVAEGRIYISSDSDGLVVYGRIPRVIASCGLYLKKNGLDIEGIFRLSGSAKRIKQLQLIFSTAPDYGSKVDWDGFTVHDAASLFRRFLSSLPEPLIPLSLYESFREPLKSRPMIVKYLKDKEKRMTMTPNPPAIPANANVNVNGTGTGTDFESHGSKKISVASNNDKSTTSQSSTADSKATTTATGTTTTTTINNEQQVEDEETKRKKKKLRKQKLIQERRNALKEYAGLFDKLPELQRQLLFYILDLLAIFNSHSDKNLMPAKNLAAIFQPSILSHTSHDMSPDEYALSSLVIEFMIEYSYKILPAAQESVKLAAKNNKRNDEQSQHRHHHRRHHHSTSTGSVPGPMESTGGSGATAGGDSTSSSLPPKTTYVTRKHSKSLSAVQNPPDLVRVSKSKGRGSTKPKLHQTTTNSTTDDNLDSGVDSDDEGTVLSIHQQLEKQLAGSGPSATKTTVPGSGFGTGTGTGTVAKPTDQENKDKDKGKDKDNEVSEQIATPASTDSTAINAIPEILHNKNASQATAISAQTTIAASNQVDVPAIPTSTSTSGKADDNVDLTVSGSGSGFASGSPSNDKTIPVDSSITPDQSEQVSPVSAEPANLENKLIQQVSAPSSESTVQPQPQQQQPQPQPQQQNKDDQLSPSKPVSESKSVEQNLEPSSPTTATETAPASTNLPVPESESESPSESIPSPAAVESIPAKKAEPVDPNLSLANTLATETATETETETDSDARRPMLFTETFHDELKKPSNSKSPPPLITRNALSSGTIKEGHVLTSNIGTSTATDKKFSNSGNAIANPPPIKVLRSESVDPCQSLPQSIQSSSKPVNIVPQTVSHKSHNNNNNPTSPTGSVASSPSSHSFFHSIASKTPLKILTSPRIRASSIDDTLSQSQSQPLQNQQPSQLSSSVVTPTTEKMPLLDSSLDDYSSNESSPTTASGKKLSVSSIGSGSGNGSGKKYPHHMLRRGSKESTILASSSSVQQQHGSQQTSPGLFPSTDASTNLSASLNSSAVQSEKDRDRDRDYAVLSGDESETVNSGERESRWDYHSHSSKLEAPGMASGGGREE
ncbi:unnamed protein product [Ambrosiozyma monospora]|uniref:Unnamed protein product n=1 Tax=Ambrosiozyma monospora TaxID=43982 RepID=A0A9W7DK70_AMBMO|nr:unnamed protein product [Ambrosiozyma monospora]